MKLYLKRFVATCLTLAVTVGCFASNAQAPEQGRTSDAPEQLAAAVSSAAEQTDASPADDAQESAATAGASDAQSAAPTDNTGAAADTATNADANTGAGADTDAGANAPADAAGGIKSDADANTDTDADHGADADAAADAYKLSYVVVDKPMVATPDAQKILVGIGDEDTTVEQAVLTVRSQENDATIDYEATELTSGAALFQAEYTAEQTGVYELDSIRYTCDGVENTLSFADAGIQAYYGVDAETETAPDAVVTEDTGDTETDSTDTADVVFDVTKLEDGGDGELADQITDALGAADADVASAMSMEDMTNEISTYAEGRASNIVVTLDPGHDNTHAGAQGNGLAEEKLTLKIAQYCKAELEEYTGVTVRLSRSTDGSCPYPGTSSTTCNANRVAAAVSAGSSYFVSIHLNSADSSVNGAEVYYPNSNYRPSIGSDGKGLAASIQKQLVALGLKDRGIKIRNSGDNTLYPDGSLADYYGVIKRCKQSGIPGIIIEHAFLTNSSDAKNFLSTESGLKKLGVADATGIANYLGLSKVPTVTGSLSFQTLNASAGTFRVNITNVNRPDVVQSMRVAVWTVSSLPGTQADQDDLVWMDAKKGSNGTWYVDVDPSAHGYEAGYYRAQCYVTDIKGEYYKLAEGNTSITSTSGAKLSASYNAAAGTVEVTLGSSKLSASTIKFALAGDASIPGSSNSLTWTQAQQQGSDWKVTIPLAGYDNRGGSYTVHCYRYDSSGNGKYVGSTSVTVPKLSATFSTTETDAETGAFRVNLTNINLPGAIRNIQAAVWISGQNDTLWTDAKRSDDGTWYVDVDPADHDFKSGTYQVECYVTDTADATYLLSSGSREVKSTAAEELTATLGVTQTNSATGAFRVSITDVSNPAAVASIEASVWSDNAGQDDLVQTTATRSGDSWYVDVDTKDHDYDNGSYQIQCYVTDTSGNRSLLCEGSYTVNLHSIMGQTTSPAQMAAFYRSKNKTFPESVYNMTLDQFCQLYYDECNAEGVDAAVAFCQAMIETGWLQYGGQVKVEQLNFAGIKTRDGSAFATFASVQEGIRAQVQHLKGYATTEDLNNTCVDPRFVWVKRGSAKYVEWLCSKDNPNGTGWTPDAGYGSNILGKMADLSRY